MAENATTLATERAQKLAQRLVPHWATLDKTQAEAVFHRLASTLRDHRTVLRDIHTNQDLVWEAKERRFADETQATQRLIAGLEAAALVAKQAIEAAVSETLDYESTDPTERLLGELELQRRWTRALSLLNSGHAPEAIARDAAQAGDRAMFRALREEVPTYMRARGDNEQMVEGIMELIDREEAPVLPADMGLAKTTQRDLEERWYFWTWSLNAAREELRTGRPALELQLSKTEVIDMRGEPSADVRAASRRARQLEPAA